MVASTNLVFEIFIVIVTLLGWAFFAGEIAGGLIFIVISALVIAWIYPSKVKQEAAQNASHGGEEKDEHDKHAHHTMAHGHRGKLQVAAGYSIWM
jgi:uncharacterized protein